MQWVAYEVPSNNLRLRQLELHISGLFARSELKLQNSTKALFDSFSSASSDLLPDEYFRWLCSKTLDVLLAERL